MAPRGAARFQCSECQSLLPKWSGQCPECKGWNSVEELKSAAAMPGLRAGWHGPGQRPEPVTLDQVPTSDSPRFAIGIDELDRVLGGGLVEGSVILLGGDPGIGKSTILLQCLALISQQRDALYVTGEESPQQVSMRARRLNLPRAKGQFRKDRRHYRDVLSKQDRVYIAQRFSREIEMFGYDF